ncbi:hypothetical protein NL676_027473 [Syzygium grande]|nr:hypothetical protein NL676_027473 [Syzygium grande]
MEDLREMLRAEQEPEQEQESQSGPPHMTPLKPLTHDAYGGGMYGTDDRQGQQQEERPPASKPPASDTQSADGPVGPPVQPKHRPPPSTGDRDLDITGQSYIQ